MKSIKRLSGRTLLACTLMLAMASGLYGQKEEEVSCRVCLGIYIADTGEMLVERVWEDSPAEKGGLRVGDVLISVNGVPATRPGWGRAAKTLQIGEPAEIVVRRNDRTVTLTIIPGTPEEAFEGEYTVVEVEPGHWDSVYVQIVELKEGHLALQAALKEAEHALRDIKRERPLTEEQEELAATLRVQIDSINVALTESYELIRAQTDSLAARTLRVKPVEIPDMPDLQVRITGPDERTVVVYSDAVAGARFKVLQGEQAEYFDVDGGLLIVEVVEDTPAHNAGLREFDVVIAVNGESVTTISEFRRLIQSGPVELTFVRKGKKQTCEIGND